ncbi:MAG: prepilin-type N-terminal cleavage/methylation domain-containing protein [Planctomycetota bacterium]|nr:MAG: prepilin-type N-terminal cleavage/methylation domain-containing protein [Planctomycetota bacterium]
MTTHTANPNFLAAAGWARRTRDRAFTVVELLVVIAIIVIVLTIAVPSFRALVYSSERSLAFNSVESAVASARDLALRSSGGDDGAVVFLFDAGGPMRIVPAVRVGSYRQSLQPDNLADNGSLTMDVFAPVQDVPPIEMPRNWHVRGYAPSGSTLEMVPGRPRPIPRWYNSETVGSDIDSRNERNWLFPESGFFPIDQQTTSIPQGRWGVNATARQSFMIRFDARTGGLSSNRGLALLVDPRPSTENRPGGERPNVDQLRLRPDRAADLVQWTRSILSAAPFNPSTGVPLPPPYRSTGDSGRAEYIGIDSNDTVLLKPVTRIAVYDERRLAQALGARGLNAGTGTIYDDIAPDAAGTDAVIRFDETLFRDGFDPDTIRRNINSWIEGDTNLDGRIGGDPEDLPGDLQPDEPQARLYLIRPLTGELTEVLR